MTTKAKAKAMTFEELGAAIAAMTPEQRSRQVTWVGEERGGSIARLWILEEDHVNFGDGFEPASSYSHEQVDVLDGDVLPAGHPLLVSDEPEAP